MHKIAQLSTEQKALIPIYINKWRNIGLSTERIDRHKVQDTIEAAYQFLGYLKPEILFFESIKQVNENIIFILEERIPDLYINNHQRPFMKKVGNRLEKPLYQDFYRKIFARFCDLVWQYVKQEYYYELVFNSYWQDLYDVYNALCYSQNNCKVELSNSYREHNIDNQSILKIKNKLSEKIFSNSLQSFIQITEFWFYDYFNDVIIQKLSAVIFKLYESIIIDCHVIIPFKNICFVCNRPTKILFDNCGRLHAEGESAIEYSDGLKIYAHHGLALPEKYGRIYPHQWQSKWLSTELDSRLKKVLTEELSRRDSSKKST